MIEKKQIEALRQPMLPANDTERMKDAALSQSYDKLTSEISNHNALVDAYLVRSGAALECVDGKTLKGELPALATEQLRLAVNAISLAARSVELKKSMRQVHSEHRTAMSKIQAEVSERKKAQLKELNNGELPWNWLSILNEITTTENAAVLWQPGLLYEVEAHPNETPTAKAKATLRAIVAQEIGFAGV